MNSQHKQRLQVKANTLRESKLRGNEGMSFQQTHYQTYAIILCYILLYS